MNFYMQFRTENSKHQYLCPSQFQIICKGSSTLLRELTDLFHYRQPHILCVLHDGILSYDEQFKMLKYNNTFTIHTYIYYSEGKSNLNNKNEIDKQNNKNVIVVYIYIFIHSLFNLQCHRM